MITKRKDGNVAMHLNGKDIEKQCNRKCLINGRALYASKAVNHLSVSNDYGDVKEYIVSHVPQEEQEEICAHLPAQEDACTVYTAKAEVTGSTGRQYQVSLLFDDEAEDKFLYQSCTCEGFEGHDTPFCRHLVALAHSIVMQQIKDQFEEKLMTARELMKKEEAKHLTFSYPQPSLNRQTGRPSSAVVGQMIKNYSGQDGSLWMQAGEETVAPGSVILIPNLVTGSKGQQRVEFRIGTSRYNYVVKDVEELILNIQRAEYHRYGNRLEFLHTRDAFDPDSLFYIDMLQDIMSIYPDPSYYFSYADHARYINLTEGYVEQIILRNVDEGIRINGVLCYVKQKNPDVTLSIAHEEEGATFTIQDYTILKGVTKTFLVEEEKKKVYVVSDGFAQAVVPFLELLKKNWDVDFRSIYRKKKEQQCFLNEHDYTAFCGYVLRKLEKYVTVSQQEVDVLSYMPPQCQIEIYLDTPIQERISLRLLASYDGQQYNLADWSTKDQGTFRDYQKEQQVYALAKHYFPKHERKDGEVFLYCDTEEEIFLLVTEGLSQLKQYGQMYVSDTIRQIHVKKTPKVTAGVMIKGDLLSLHVDIPDMDSGEMEDILEAYRLKKHYYRMKNGDFMQLDQSGLSTLAKVSESLAVHPSDWKNGEVNLPLYRANYIDTVFKERGKNMKVVRSAEFKSVIRDMNEIENSDYELPEGIKAELRGYQKTGYRWLCTLTHYGFGGVLADDMGLGKTLQVITLLQAKVEDDSYDRSQNQALIVCPASLLYNWESECKKFAPDLRTRILSGTLAVRKELLHDLSDVDVVITSYDLLKRDLKLYEALSFSFMILDEAQYIKNASTQVAKAVKSIVATHRFALTGTPLENRLSDLWSIFDFVMKGYLYRYERFRNQLEQPIVSEHDEEALNRLKQMVAPFILRRRKKDVLKDLPDKLEQNIYTSMTKEQEKYYKARFLALRKQLLSQSEQEFNKDKIKVLAEITRLRQLCCDPALFVEDYQGGSGKVDTFLAMAEELTDNKSNLLVFSQFASMLQILKEQLTKQGIHTLMLTGRNTKEERHRMVEEFQNGEATVFLISLKAGGTGLNLTAADTVIHFDPWWNVAAQNQATDRAHRIGQDKVVTVIQLVMKNSIEERILELQQMKKELVDQVVEGEAVASAALTKEEILRLLDDF